MPPTQAQQRYLLDAVSTASPARLVVMLYDRLGLDLRRANESLAEGDRLGATGHIAHAQQIIAEFMSTLRTDAWAGAGNLMDVYGFLLRELIAVNGSGDATRLAPVVEIVTGLRNSWAEAAELMARETVDAARSTSAAAPAGLGSAYADTAARPSVAWVG